jgi:hypothetical protein
LILFATSMSIIATFSSQVAAIPITKNCNDRFSENYSELRCNNLQPKEKVNRHVKEEINLRERLQSAASGCNLAYHSIKNYSDQNWEAMWNLDTEGVDKAWKNKTLKWLLPSGKRLEIDFEGNLDEKHLEVLKHTDFSKNVNVLKYLAKIYESFLRVKVGLGFVIKWSEKAQECHTSLLSTTQIIKNLELFKSADRELQSVLCDIQSILLDLKIDPRLGLDFSPFVLDKLLKLNHWVIYREYVMSMKYARQVFKIMTE